MRESVHPMDERHEKSWLCRVRSYQRILAQASSSGSHKCAGQHHHIRFVWTAATGASGTVYNTEIFVAGSLRERVSITFFIEPKMKQMEDLAHLGGNLRLQAWGEG